MTTQLNDNSKNGGLLVLVMLSRFQGIAADPEHICHQFRGTPIGIAEMLRYAKQRGIKARVSTTDWSRLSKVPLPAIAALNDGGFLVLAKSGDNKILVQDPNSQCPQLMTRARGDLERVRRAERN